MELSGTPLLAFGFGHLAMLGWLAAAAAPLLIHLWNRRRYREMEWAAIEYLLAALRKNARRVQIEQWILLAVRTLVIALVVLALAEPFVERLGLSATGNQRTHKLLVLDASFSMGYKPTDKSRFERAQELAAQIVDEASAGDGFTLVLLANPPRVVVGSPSFEPREFKAEIANQHLLHAGSDLAATLQLVENVLSQTEREHPRLARQEVYFLSDLQRQAWLPAGGAAGQLGQIRQLSKRIADRAALAVIDLGQTDSDNLAVTRFRAAEPLATLDRETTLEAEIHNFGRQPRARQLVELLVGGNRAGETYVDLPAEGSAIVSFPYRFDAGGEHALEILAAGDPLEIDNHRWLALPVKETIRVLCVNGKPAGGSFQQTTDYLTVALAPRSGDAPGGVRPEVITESELAERELAQYDAVFLCNVAQFTGDEARLLEDYLRQGGGLVFFLGDQVQADNYNRQLAGDAGGPRILPARLGERAPQAQYRFDPLEYKHPLVGPFRNQEQAGLLTSLVTDYIRLTPHAGSAQVALAFQNGDPAIVAESLHGGRSLIVATSADTSWTTMPVWPSYVPVVQELLAWCAGARLQERNTLVGQPLAGIATPVGKAAMVRNPRHELLAVEVRDRGALAEWTFAETFTSGVYALEPAGATSPAALYAVNVDTAESDLAPLTAAELRSEVWPGIRFAHQTSWQNLDEHPAAEVTRQNKLHVWLLTAVLGLLFCETFLGWRFGHR
ncbi:MAG: BatA domain-containing protein [Planctomycetaceae bacterium]|nr:BatA domain-containing protein [Planctomycetaceae bacterium]